MLHAANHEPVLPEPVVQHAVELARGDDVGVEACDRLDPGSLQRGRDVLAAEGPALRGEGVELERQRRQVHARRVELELQIETK